MSATTRTLSCLALLAVLAFSGAEARPEVAVDDDGGDASAGVAVSAPNTAVQAAFTARSYRPGATATLALRGGADRLRVQIWRAGAAAGGPLQGRPVAPSQWFAHAAGSIRLRIGAWPSGFYYARVETPRRGEWYAPFVLRPKRLGEHRIAVVLPTNTWQAYNFEDGGSWYADASVHTIDLSRPYVDGGVPPHYHGYDRGFVRWLTVHRVTADFFSDDDLDGGVTGDELSRRYDLIVFSGHEEYVTEHEFDVVRRYRDRGGNLAFLSSNNFFYKVVKSGDRMDGRWRWRDIGRPEAALVGAQYVDWNHDHYPNRPYVVTDRRRAPWLFRGTALRRGSTFGVYGIEVDAVAAASPRGTHVLARIANIFGPGKSAEMTYYTTGGGAKVFAAGVMNFGGSAMWPVVRTMVGNLIAYLSRP